MKTTFNGCLLIFFIMGISINKSNNLPFSFLSLKFLCSGIVIFLFFYYENKFILQITEGVSFFMSYKFPSNESTTKISVFSGLKILTSFLRVFSIPLLLLTIIIIDIIFDYFTYLYPVIRIITKMF